MNSRALRRLAADHGVLHNRELPPNYLFPASSAHADDLTQLDILLAGPTHTPFAAGVWKLHLTIPPNYPQQPPTANFRTPIFHPNVDSQTGGVCVETLKRDWDSKLTLRDVLITISCLLIQPNPDSALNAEAGALIREDYSAFARRAELMTSIHAVVPSTIQSGVREAQNRGQEHSSDQDRNSEGEQHAVPARRRRTVAGVRAAQRLEDSSAHTPTRQHTQAAQHRPFVFQAGSDDVFGVSTPLQTAQPMGQIYEDDETMDEGDQENDAARSPLKAATPAPAATPRRPNGVSVPLGELILEQEDSSSDMEPEYPPSPRKSPSKSPSKRRPEHTYDSSANIERAESSRDAALRAPNITPPNNNSRPLAEDSPFMDFTMDVTMEPFPGSPRVRHGLFETPPKRPGVGRNIFSSGKEVVSGRVANGHGILKTKMQSTADRKYEEEQKRAALEDKLWKLCGGDIRRWNRGDFDGQPLKKKVARW